MANKKVAIGYTEAIETVLENIVPLNGGTAPLADCVDRVTAEDLYASVNSPSVDASLKDGFAVRSKDIEKAAPGAPVRLRVIGTADAGMPSPEKVDAGTAVRILTGAKIPAGADAVVAEEFTHIEDEYTMSCIQPFLDCLFGLHNGLDIEVGWSRNEVIMLFVCPLYLHYGSGFIAILHLVFW